MTQSDLPIVRRLVQNGAYSFSDHAYSRMLERDISFDDLEAILTSCTNQIIECQSPSMTPGKEHADERVLLYDPRSSKDAIVVFIVLFTPTPELRVITVENVDEKIWKRKQGIPCLVRKRGQPNGSTD